jgi:two-component system response regulator FixJ
MIFITARDDAQITMQAMTAGAVAFLFKPFDDELLMEKVRTALERGGAWQ